MKAYIIKQTVCDSINDLNRGYVYDIERLYIPSLELAVTIKDDNVYVFPFHDKEEIGNSYILPKTGKWKKIRDIEIPDDSSFLVDVKTYIECKNSIMGHYKENYDTKKSK